jgi:tRNA A-37 threonylcarbamoyl transferase component Bud32
VKAPGKPRTRAALSLDSQDGAASDLSVATSGAPQSEDGSLLSGIVFEGRFRIEERIAEGGFAVVYKAVQVALDRQVALKVLKMPRFHDATSRAEFRDKFAEEAKTIARIRHPHIVDVYDFSVSTLGSGELAPWMALEWLEGETLASFLKRERATGGRGLAAREAVDLLRPAIEALAHAHSRGIVHRDVKPANIMVASTPNGRSLRVLDFGIAKIMADDQGPSTGDTRTESAPAFSPFYAAPEQVTFSRTGPWTDVHALGLILSELMTGEAPFGSRDPDAHMFEQVMASRRPTPASKGRDVGAFEPVVAKALALSPRDRWKNAGELLAALDAARLGHTPVVPEAPAAPRKVSRSAAVLGVLATTLGFGGGLALYRRARRTEPTTGAAAPVARERAPAAPAPVVTSPRPPAPFAEAAPASPPPPTVASPARRRGAKRRPSAALREGATKAAPVDVKPPENDGADLFNDTK